MANSNRTIGEMCNSRLQWHIKPVTKVKASSKVYNRKRDKQAYKKHI